MGQVTGEGFKKVQSRKLLEVVDFFIFLIGVIVLRLYVYIYTYVSIVLSKCHLLYVICAFKFCKNLIKKQKSWGKYHCYAPSLNYF